MKHELKAVCMIDFCKEYEFGMKSEVCMDTSQTDYLLVPRNSLEFHTRELL